jgi:hypothetical protein
VAEVKCWEDQLNLLPGSSELPQQIASCAVQRSTHHRATSAGTP